jgi:hypothetical protein
VGARKRRTRGLQGQRQEQAKAENQPVKEAPYERLLRKLREDRLAIQQPQQPKEKTQ